MKTASMAKSWMKAARCARQMTSIGGILKYGTVKALSVAPPVPTLPEKKLSTAFDEFGTVYTLVWIRRNGH